MQKNKKNNILELRKVVYSMFTWIKGNANASILTFSTNNITLNSSAATYFHDVRWCMVGLDHTKKSLAIKPVSKREVDLALVDADQLHKISIGNGYARITSKAMIQEINDMIAGMIDGCKVRASFCEESNMMIADLNNLMKSSKE